MILQRFSRVLTRFCENSKVCIRTNFLVPEPVIDWQDVVSDPEKYKEMLIARKEENGCHIITNILDTWNRRNEYTDDHLAKKLNSLASQLPNSIHPQIRGYRDDFRLMKTHGEKKEFPFMPVTGAEILQEKDLLRMSNLNLYCGERSYYFIGDLVKLEQALIDFSVQKLLNEGFSLISVPDILTVPIVEGCGMPTSGERTQTYKLDQEIHGSGRCLSGTSEMAIAAFFMNSNIPRALLPKYYTAVSRCYRAEISHLSSERGIYRVHQFTKVEMFGVCLPEQSEDILELFRKIEEDIFSSFDIHYRVIDMSPRELGRHAQRKYDIEAWMPGMKKYGEISSCSNCTDYQTRRLNIKSEHVFLHTVNGTACAIPRMVNTLTETNQNVKGRVHIPTVLQPLMGIDTLGLKRGPNCHRTKNISKIFTRQ